MTNTSTSPAKFDFTASLEFLVKGVSIILGFLFVIGLLIANSQLISLGIADFSEFSTRNIMIGALYLYYLGLMALALLPGITLIWFLIRDRKKIKARVFIFYLFNILVLTAIFIYSSGIFIGFASPAGRTWDAGPGFDWHANVNDLRVGYGQFFDAYLHAKQGVALLILFLGITFTSLFRKFVDPSPSILKKMFNVLLLFCAVLALFLSISGYAENVYPNMQFGLGGGQPQIVQLQINSESSDSFRVLGVNVDKPYQNSALTQPVAIWYQSSRYLYLTPLPSKDDQINLVAVDQDKILGILYLRQYVKVRTGEQITNMPVP